MANPIILLILINLIAPVILVDCIPLSKERSHDKREDQVWHCKMLCLAECSSWAEQNLEYCNKKCIESRASANALFNAKFNCKHHDSYVNSVFF